MTNYQHKKIDLIPELLKQFVYILFHFQAAKLLNYTVVILYETLAKWKLIN